MDKPRWSAQSFQHCDYPTCFNFFEGFHEVHEHYEVRVFRSGFFKKLKSGEVVVLWVFEPADPADQALSVIKSFLEEREDGCVNGLVNQTVPSYRHGEGPPVVRFVTSVGLWYPNQKLLWWWLL
jgi:hypothetical protein